LARIAPYISPLHPSIETTPTSFEQPQANPRTAAGGRAWPSRGSAPSRCPTASRTGRRRSTRLFDLLRRGEHADQIAARRLFEGLREQGRAKGDEQMRLRLETIDEQIKTARARIESEFEEACHALHERIVCTYCQIDVALKRQLKELMVRAYGAYLAANAIDFPRMPPRRRCAPGSTSRKARLASAEVERDIRRIQQKYVREWSSTPRAKELPCCWAPKPLKGRSQIAVKCLPITETGCHAARQRAAWSASIAVR
jgi:hypothetical protein